MSRDKKSSRSDCVSVAATVALSRKRNHLDLLGAQSSPFARQVCTLVVFSYRDAISALYVDVGCAICDNLRHVLASRISHNTAPPVLVSLTSPNDVRLIVEKEEKEKPRRPNELLATEHDCGSLDVSIRSTLQETSKFSNCFTLPLVSESRLPRRCKYYRHGALFSVSVCPVAANNKRRSLTVISAGQ